MHFNPEMRKSLCDRQRGNFTLEPKVKLKSVSERLLLASESVTMAAWYQPG